LDPAASRTNILSKDPFVKMQTIQRVNRLGLRLGLLFWLGFCQCMSILLIWNGNFLYKTVLSNSIQQLTDHTLLFVCDQ